MTNIKEYACSVCGELVALEGEPDGDVCYCSKCWDGIHTKQLERRATREKN